MSKRIDPAPRLNFVFEMIADAASRGERCPTSDEIRDKMWRQHLTALPSPVSDLARAGRIVVWVHARNWRVVEILMGPARGCRTAEAPNGRRAYLRIDHHGTHALA